MGFKGRTEQIKGDMQDNTGKYIGSLDGSWTESLMLMPENQKIWRLVNGKKPDDKYDFPSLFPI